MIVKNELGQYVVKGGECVTCKYHKHGAVCMHCDLTHSLWESKIKYKPKDIVHIDTDAYYTFDTETAKAILNSVYGGRAFVSAPYAIEKVIFNDPATIVLWKDGTKTVVKVQEGDIFDPEKGLAMAIVKKVYGNNYHAYDKFKKWIKKYKPEEPTITTGLEGVAKAFRKLGEDLNKS